MVQPPQPRLVTGILAHVDAGKTTLSEAFLYLSGSVRRLGRVDHRDAFLDTHELERERGITIFAKQAVFDWKNTHITLLDTPGHADFSAEMERTLRVLDCAVLVISGTDGVQAHTHTVWRLLERYQVPVFLFVNKMDLDGSGKTALLAELKQRLSEFCIDFTQNPEQIAEEAALSREDMLERYLASGELTDADTGELIRQRAIFPCFFGSALKLTGIEPLLDALGRFAPATEQAQKQQNRQTFGARVFKISKDTQGTRLTWLKVTSGSLKVKDLLTVQNQANQGTVSRQSEQAKSNTEKTESDSEKAEKADQIRLYSGVKYTLLEQAQSGDVVAVTGPRNTHAGDALGQEEVWAGPILEPVLAYRIDPEDGTDKHTLLTCLRQLEEEDPQLKVVWNHGNGELRVHLMGPIQLEILRRILEQRFSLQVAFGAGEIVYRETIAAPVEGIGHFEPLRHYAEVRLLLEPGARGSGLQFATACSEDVLSRNWQRLILTHLAEKTHLGVLTGSPITDMRITLLSGRAHEKHTEGGDFRQATYRAVRQGLMSAENILLEPWYEFRLELPIAQAGRAIHDIQRMNGEMNPQEIFGEEAVLTGYAPVAEISDYATEVTAYTRGQGRLFLTVSGNRPCQNPERIIEAMAYLPERDLDNPVDSVFCSHGAGRIISWRDVAQYAHTEQVFFPPEPKPPPEANPDFSHSAGYISASGEHTGTSGESTSPGGRYADNVQQDKELQAIFERTYGLVKRQAFEAQKKPARPPSEPIDAEHKAQIISLPKFDGTEYLLVDGYNIIYAWDALKAIAAENLDSARIALCDILSNYQGYRGCQVIIVFDAYKVKGGVGSIEKYHNIYVVYTREAQTADAFIERATYEIAKKHRVRVATSDGPEQLIILGHGALRVSALGLLAEVEDIEGYISDTLTRHNRAGQNQTMRSALERAESIKKQCSEPKK